MQAEFRAVVPPRVQRGFEVSRRKLVEALGQLTFMRVTTINFPNDTYRTGTHFQGEAEEIFPGRNHHHSSKTAFFSRFARQTGNGFNLLGCVTLIDCPIGPAHPSSTPQIGDILVGSLIPAKSGKKLGFELRGWCNNAKPLLELARIVQFGTRMSEKEIQGMLRQPASASAGILLRLNPHMPAAEKAYAENAVKAADDLWQLARVVCFGHLTEDTALKLSKSYVDMIDTITMRFSDEELLDAWSKVRPQTYAPEAVTVPYAQAFAPVAAYSWQNPVILAAPAPIPPAPRTPVVGDYAPGTPVAGGTPPAYAPASPAYVPSSPV